MNDNCEKNHGKEAWRTRKAYTEDLTYCEEEGPSGKFCLRKGYFNRALKNEYCQAVGEGGETCSR